MKKSIFVALICLLGFSQTEAQVKFRPGVKAGLNFARFTQTDNPNERYTSITDFYAGVFGAIEMSKVYTMQPELTYTRQGSGVEYVDQNNIRYEDKINVSYISFALANKFTFDKINVHVGPTFDIRVNDSGKELGAFEDDYYYDSDYDNDVDLAFFIGAGYEITKNLGIEARVKKGIVPVNGDWDSENLVFQTGINYKF